MLEQLSGSEIRDLSQENEANARRALAIERMCNTSGASLSNDIMLAPIAQIASDISRGTMRICRILDPDQLKRAGIKVDDN